MPWPNIFRQSGAAASVNTPCATKKASVMKVKFATSSKFAHEVHRRALQELLARGENRFADTGQWLRAAIYLAGSATAYAIALFASESSLLTPLATGVAAILALMVAATVGHDASHGVMSSKRWVNRVALFGSFSLLGVCGDLWGDRHVRLHHGLPNIQGNGIDADGSSLLRLCPYKPFRSIYRWQPAYCFVIYFLSFVHLVWIEDWTFLREALRRRPAERWQLIASFLTCKLVHLIVTLVVPMVVLGPNFLSWLLCYLSAMGCASIAFVLLAVPTHLCEPALFQTPDDAGSLPHDWTTHQVFTSVDWSPDDKLLIALLAGANAHVAHHVFPRYSHRHALWLTRIIRDSANTYGVSYRALSYWELLVGHWRHIQTMSHEGVI